jgi:hypothetical protein
VKVYLLEMSTRHFEFTAIGRTPDEARQEMVNLIDKHCRKYPEADRDYLMLDVEDDEPTELSVPGGKVV